MSVAVTTALTTAERALRTRHYDASLRAVESVASWADETAVSRMRRQCLGRMGRVSEAAAVGREVLGRVDAMPDDFFRQAQILVQCGDWRGALDAALTGWEREPDGERYVVPVAQAVLADPGLQARLPSYLDRSPAFAEGGAPDRLFSPQILPIYRPFDGDHPGTMVMLRQAGDIPTVAPRALPPEWRGRVAATIRAAIPLTEAVAALHPAVDRAAAARYVGARLPIRLADAGGAGLDYLTNVPVTLGQRPFLLWYDTTSALFQPFQPFDDTNIGPDGPWYWITRAFLESERCVAIITHYALDGNPLNRLFASPDIAAKLVHIRPSETDHGGAAAANGEVEPTRPAKPTRLLFTSSHTFRDEVFYYRGGVDVIAAFLALADEFPDIELVLRTALPDTLGMALRRAVERHPRIRWLPEPLASRDFHDLVTSSHILLQPSAVLYRNTIVHALQHGVVPVVSDILGMDELIRHGETGVIVPGRAAIHRVDDAEHRVIQHLIPLLQATDAPADPLFHAALVKGLRDLLRHPKRLVRLGAAAHRDAVSSWDFDANLVSFRGVLETSMARAARQTRPSARFLPRQE